MPFKAIEISPLNGGNLMVDPGSESVGISNYAVKRDWRRDQDKEVRSEGYEEFNPNIANDPPALPDVDEPVSLVHRLRHPNGETGFIAGTPSRLFRFFSEQNGGYFVEEGDSTYYVDGLLEDQAGKWVEIGSGFSKKGHRWEVAEDNGYLIFNNERDPAQSYRLTDSEVSPIHELREQGVAFVGTIAEFKGILMAGDVAQIQPTELIALMTPTRGLQELVTAASPQYGDTGHGSTTYRLTTVVGVTYTYTPGESELSLTNGSETLTEAGDFVAEGAFVDLTSRAASLDVTASVKGQAVGTQTGMTMAAAQGTVNNGTTGLSGNILTAASAIFTGAHIGQAVRMMNGLSRTILSLGGPSPSTTAILDGDPDRAEPTMPIYLPSSGTTDYTVTVTSPGGDVFDSSMVGAKLIWDSGEVRTIESVVDGKTVIVDLEFAIPGGPFRIENINAHKVFTDRTSYDRIGYRTIWSMNDEPRRFAAVIPCSATAGSYQVIMDYPAYSLQVGKELTVAGAALNGGNLIAKIGFIDASFTRVTLVEQAQTTVTDTFCQMSDAAGSIVGTDDLQDDGSSILRMLQQRDVLVIYKQTSIMLGAYTGDPAAPFVFEPVYKKGDRSLYYKHTLIPVAGQYHLYAGKNSWYRFDLGNRIPADVGKLEFNESLFYDHAHRGKILDDSLLFAPTVVSTQVNDGHASRSNVKSLVIKFDMDVGASLAAGDFTVENLTAATTISNKAVAWNAATFEATLTFPGESGTGGVVDALPDGDYRLTIASAGVQNVDGTGLVTDYVFDFHALYCDVNGDRRVTYSLIGDPSDVESVNDLIGGEYHVGADVDDDGDIDIDDRNLVATIAVLNGTLIGQVHTYDPLGTAPTPVTPPAGLPWTQIDNLDPGISYIVQDDTGEYELVDLVDSVIHSGKKLAKFFGAAKTIDQFSVRPVLFDDTSDMLFCADNGILQEIWICFPYADGPDKAIRIDYQWESVSTTSIAITAAGMAERPGTSVQLKEEDWFIMGTKDGKVLRYGATNDRILSSNGITAIKPYNSNRVTASAPIFLPSHRGKSIRFDDGKLYAITGYVDARNVDVLGATLDIIKSQSFRIVPKIWHRSGTDYDSVLEAGLESFGNSTNEKEINGYELKLDYHEEAFPIDFELLGARHPFEKDVILSATIQDAQSARLLPMIAVAYYLADRLTVSGKNNPAEIVGRVMHINGIRSKSIGRQQR